MTLEELLRQGKSFGQGASNAAASTVTGPVDMLAWLLRKGGVDVGEAPIGGEAWMRQKGLMATPENRLAGLLGEGAGLAAPIVAAAKAPEIAGGLLQMGRNLAAPTPLNKQAGAINVDALKEKFPSIDFSLSQRGDKATLSKVVVPKDARNSGIGSSFMDDLTRAADADGAQLALSPSGDFGGSKTRLVEFYKRFGFVPNKGKNIDFSISEAMRRDPLKGGKP